MASVRACVHMYFRAYVGARLVCLRWSSVRSVCRRSARRIVGLFLHLVNEGVYAHPLDQRYGPSRRAPREIDRSVEQQGVEQCALSAYKYDGIQGGSRLLLWGHRDRVDQHRAQARPGDDTDAQRGGTDGIRSF
eukprot:GHVU01146582.1.p2 GENE.GHVU01146582.1~~GHVU01146582.1.p2  ORF type:complete len:134 (-),score=3.48 GHVU01146582.1:232-633(-)